jgi:hypothetical protein
MSIKPVFGDYSPYAVDPAVSLFLPPPFVNALEALWFELTTALDQAVTGSVIYNQPFSQAKTTEYLKAIASACLHRVVGAAFWVVFVSLGDTLRFTTQESGRLGKINAEWELTSEDGKRLTLPRMKDFRPDWASQEHSFQKGMIHIGHAGVFINHSSPVLIDPVFNAYLSPHSVGEVEAIFYTHSHSDHFDLQSILSFDRGTPIYVPRQSGQPFEPNMVALLSAFGFTSVKQVTAGERIVLSDQSYMDVLPFYGESRELVGFPGQCFLYSGHDRRVFFHADASPDKEWNSILNCKDLKEKIQADGPVDTVFGTWWQKRVFQLQLSPLILLKTFHSTDWLSVVENCDCSIDFTCELLKLTGAKTFVTYAERREDAFKPLDQQSSYIARETFYWQPHSHYAEVIKARVGAQTLQATPLLSY